MTTSVAQAATGNPLIDGLLSGSKWSSHFSYSFPQDTGDYPAGYGDELDDFAAVSFQQREATRAILSGETSSVTTNVMLATSVSSFIAFSAVEVGGIGNGFNGLGDIRLGQSDAALPTAYADEPSNAADGRGGDVWFSTAYAGTSDDYRNPYLGGYAYHTHLHELGHAMGLKHSHELGGPANVAVPAPRDAIEFTVMSYRSYVDGPTDYYRYGQFDAPQTFMQYDILALQTMYGAYYGPASNSSATVYTWSPTTGETFINGVSQGTPGGNKIFMTVWDGGGIDTFDLSNYTSDLNIDLAPGGRINLGTQLANLGDGHTASANIYLSFLFEGNTAAMIENVNGGSGNDTIVGNSAANQLNGNAGSDYITGRLIGVGDGDIAHGGADNDQLYFNGDRNELYGDADNDWLGVNGHRNTLAGGAGNEVWIGASGNNNTLDGQDGHDAVFANGTGNILFGRTGNDWLGVSGNSNWLYGQEHVDWMGASGNGNNLYGGADGDTLLSVGGNVLYGEAGGDWLGCSGNNNQMLGGAGDDYVAASGRFNILDGGANNDTLFAGASAHDHATFAFLPGYGMDQAFNFVGAVGDRIDIRGWGIVSYTALTPYLSDTAAGLVIAFDGSNQLTIHGVHALDPSWIIFV